MVLAWRRPARHVLVVTHARPSTAPNHKAHRQPTRPTPSIHPTSVTLVTTLEQLQELHSDLLTPAPSPQPHPWTRAVALDCEWQPFSNRSTKTPVSLLQVADDLGRVWLLDLLTLLCPLPNLLSAPWTLQGGNGLCWPRDVSEEEALLGALLHALLTRDDIVKVLPLCIVVMLVLGMPCIYYPFMYLFVYFSIYLYPCLCADNVRGAAHT